MSIKGGPKIETSGLQLYYDVDNIDSYPGQPATNLQPIGSGGTLLTAYTGDATYATATRISMNHPEGDEVHEIWMSMNGSNGYYGSPNVCRITGYAFAPALGTVYYGIWIHMADFDDYIGITDYITGNAGWPSIGYSGRYKIVDGRTWRWYHATTTSTVTGGEYFTWYKNGTWTADKTFYVAGPMVHQESNYYIPFVNGTRSSTNGLKDLSGNGIHADLISGSYDSNALLRWNADTSGNADVNSSNWSDIAIATPFDIYNISYWGKSDSEINAGYAGYYPVHLKFGAVGDFQGQIQNGSWTGGATSETYHMYNNAQANTLTYLRAVISTDWHYFTWNWNGSSYDCYIDGVLQTKYAGSPGEITALINSGTNIRIANNHDTYSFRGYMDVIQLYNSQKTAQEVLNNYNAQKSRFGK